MRASKYAPCDRFRVRERRHGLAEVVERGALVFTERPRVIPPQPERVFIAVSERASRNGYRFAQQRLGFIEAP